MRICMRVNTYYPIFLVLSASDCVQWVPALLRTFPKLSPVHTVALLPPLSPHDSHGQPGKEAALPGGEWAHWLHYSVSQAARPHRINAGVDFLQMSNIDKAGGFRRIFSLASTFLAGLPLSTRLLAC